MDPAVITGHPLLDAILAYGGSCADAARHDALGQVEEAAAATRESQAHYARIVILLGGIGDLVTQSGDGRAVDLGLSRTDQAGG